jgi:endonuclease YncB( thermonuclease family)
VYKTGSSGRVVVVEGGSGSTAPAETQTPTESTTTTQPTQEPTTQPAETVEKTETTEKTESAEKSKKTTTPSDTNPDFAGSPAYEVLRVEDEGVTLVLQVDGEETKVRMIGVAPMEMRAKPRRRPPREKSDQSRPPRPAGTDRPRQPRGDSDRPEQAGKDKEPKKLTNLFMANMLRGEKVYVVYDEAVEEQDEDGKFIAYIYRAPDGLLVNMEAVRLGFAAADTSYDFADKETFQHYQEKARTLNKGIWGMMKRQRQGGSRPRLDRRPQKGAPRPTGKTS